MAQFYRSVAIIVVSVVGLMSLFLFAISKLPTLISGSPPDVLRFTLGLIATALVGLVAVLIRPLRERLDTAIGDVVNYVSRDRCRILVYGLARGGKTSLIQNLTLAPVPRTKPTESFCVYHISAPVNLDSKQNLQIEIADYLGERPSDVVVDPPRSFFGHPGARRVNALIFLVDFFPEILNEQGQPIDDDDLVRRFGNEQQIRSRVADNLEYITKHTVGLVFRVALSDRLCAVRLVLNKIDLLQRTPHSELHQSEPDSFARSCYSRLEDSLRAACKANKAANGPEIEFSTNIVSAKVPIGVRELFSEIVAAYLRNTRSTHGVNGKR